MLWRAFQKNKIFEFGCGDQILTAFGLHETNKKKFMDIDPLYGPVRAFYWTSEMSIITRLGMYHRQREKMPISWSLGHE